MRNFTKFFFALLFVAVAAANVQAQNDPFKKAEKIARMDPKIKDAIAELRTQGQVLDFVTTEISETEICTTSADGNSTLCQKLFDVTFQFKYKQTGNVVINYLVPPTKLVALVSTSEGDERVLGVTRTF